VSHIDDLQALLSRRVPGRILILPDIARQVIRAVAVYVADVCNWQCAEGYAFVTVAVVVAADLTDMFPY
jgi:hypothetical protein